MAQVTQCPPGSHAHSGHQHPAADPVAGHAPATATGPDPMRSDPARPDRFTRLGDWLRSRPGWIAPLLVLGCFAGVSSLLLANDPTDGKPDAFGGCALKLLTGFDCPGCGGTRAFWYLMHVNLPEAARHHVMAVFAAPFLVYLYVAWALRSAFGIQIPSFTLKPRMLGWFLGAWGVFMVLRNLPWAPFTFFYV